MARQRHTIFTVAPIRPGTVHAWYMPSQCHPNAASDSTHRTAPARPWHLHAYLSTSRAGGMDAVDVCQCQMSASSPTPGHAARAMAARRRVCARNTSRGVAHGGGAPCVKWGRGKPQHETKGDRKSSREGVSGWVSPGKGGGGLPATKLGKLHVHCAQYNFCFCLHESAWSLAF